MENGLARLADPDWCCAACGSRDLIAVDPVAGDRAYHLSHALCDACDEVATFIPVLGLDGDGGQPKRRPAPSRDRPSPNPHRDHATSQASGAVVSTLSHGGGAARQDWILTRLSADVPQHWLHDTRYWCLSSYGWRLHTHALMWAIGRTDGFIPDEMLSMLLPGSDAERANAAKELLASGIWELVPGGWQVADWEQSQSTVAEIEYNREKDRERQARHRATGAESHGVTNDVSTERPGTATYGTEGEERVRTGGR